jgi:hypothetical protein
MKYLTIAEYARMSGVSRQVIQYKIKAKKLKTEEIPIHQKRILVDDIHYQELQDRILAGRKIKE